MDDAEFREQVRAADELQDLSDQFEAAVERSQGTGRTLDALRDEAQKALVKAIWTCIVDASSMNVVMHGSEVNAAIRDFRAAIEVEAGAAERERIAAEIGRNLTDARIEDLMRQHAIPLHGRGISVDLQARGVAASVRAAVLAIVEPKP